MVRDSSPRMRDTKDIIFLKNIQKSGGIIRRFLVIYHEGLPHYTVYYRAGAKGFTTPAWCGYPCYPMA